MFFKFFVPLFLLVCLTAQINAQTQADQQLINQLFNNGQYDGRVRPATGADKQGPVVVTINTYVRSLTVHDNNEFDVQLTFRQKWHDDRLIFRSDDANKYLNLITPENLTWIPDTFFANEKESHFHNMLTRNEYVRVWPDGSVLHSARISLKLACNMDFRNFPLDTQICPIRMASYGYTTKDIIYRWEEENPIQFPSSLNLPSNNLDNFRTSSCDSTTNTGTYSCLRVDFTLKRAFSSYLVNIYIPCVMLVVMAYLSFWINVQALTARIILLVTTLLVLAVQTSNINSSLPQVGYTKAVDWWTGTCLTFVFVALVEFIAMQYIVRREKQSIQASGCDEENQASSKGAAQSKIQHVVQKYLQDVNAVSDGLDGACRVLFPIAFIIFVVAYTIAYYPSTSE